MHHPYIHLQFFFPVVTVCTGCARSWKHPALPWRPDIVWWGMGPIQAMLETQPAA